MYKTSGLCLMVSLGAGTAVTASDFEGYLSFYGLSESADANVDGGSFGSRLQLKYAQSFDALPLTGNLNLQVQVNTQDDGVQNSHLVREAYLDYRGNGFDVRVGKQLLLFGVADGYNPSNVVSPENLRFHGVEPQASRFGATGVKLTKFMGDWSFTGFYGFWQETSVAPARDALGAFAPDERSIAQRRDSYLLRTDYRGSSIDFGAMYYAGAANMSVLQTSIASLPSYETTDLEMVSLEAVYIGHAARYFTEIARLDYDQSTVPGLRDELAAVVGVDYEFNPKFRVIGQVFARDFEGALGSSALDAINSGSFGQYGDQQFGASVTFFYGTPDSDLSADASVAAGQGADEYYVNARMKYRLNDRSAVYLRADHFSGPDDSFFGSLEDTNRVAVEYRIQF